jgi:hypothetical protein
MRGSKVVLVFAFLAAGCSTASAPPAVPDAAAPPPDAPSPAASLVSIAITPASIALDSGEKRGLTVTGTYDDGSQAGIATGVTWASSALAVATIDDTGVVSAAGPGAATITADTAGLHASADVAVVVRVFGDDYGKGIVYAPFGGSSNGPSLDAAEHHSGVASLRFEVPGAGYTGGAFKAATAVDLSKFQAVTFWARASKPATLNVVGFGNDATTTMFACEWNGAPLTTTWTRYVVPIPDAAKLSAEHGLFHLAEGADEGAYTLWIDDVAYEVLPPGAIASASPAIATETVSRKINETFTVNGAAVTYVVGGVTEGVATARRYFTFHSSSDTIATVDDGGVVTAHAAGTATITAKLGGQDAVGALTFQVTP